MSTNKFSDATVKIVGILEKFEAVEVDRVVRAVLTLLGDKAIGVQVTGLGGQPDAPPATLGTGPSLPKGTLTEKQFFDLKQPQSKIEELAVSARYRELYLNQEECNKIDIGATITKARRNFDKGNFFRDIDHARNKGFFTRTGKKDSFTLAYHGQEFVDALPNREVLKTMKKPRKSKGVAKASKTK